MAEDYGKAGMTLHVEGVQAEEFTGVEAAEPPTNSRYVCYHALNMAGTPEPVQMQVCDCGKNAVCMVCGYAFGCYPCDCDGIPKKREPGWLPRG